MDHPYDLPDLVIASGETESNVLFDDGNYRFAHEFLISAPATLPETVTLHVSLDEGTTFQAFQRGGSDVTFTAGKVQREPYDGWDAMKLVAGAGVAADRTFNVKAVEELR